MNETWIKRVQQVIESGAGNNILDIGRVLGITSNQAGKCLRELVWRNEITEKKHGGGKLKTYASKKGNRILDDWLYGVAV